jgi:hypothetical protein
MKKQNTSHARLIITIQFCLITILAGYALRTILNSRTEHSSGSNYTTYRTLLLNNNPDAFIENDSVLAGVIEDEVTYFYFRKDHLQAIHCLDISVLNHYLNIFDNTGRNYYVESEPNEYIIYYNGDMYIPDMPQRNVTKRSMYELFEDQTQLDFTTNQ